MFEPVTRHKNIAWFEGKSTQFLMVQTLRFSRVFFSFRHSGDNDRTRLCNVHVVVAGASEQGIQRVTLTPSPAFQGQYVNHESLKLTFFMLKIKDAFFTHFEFADARTLSEKIHRCVYNVCLIRISPFFFLLLLMSTIDACQQILSELMPNQTKFLEWTMPRFVSSQLCGVTYLSPAE